MLLIWAGAFGFEFDVLAGDEPRGPGGICGSYVYIRPAAVPAGRRKGGRPSGIAPGAFDCIAISVVHVNCTSCNLLEHL